MLDSQTTEVRSVTRELRDEFDVYMFYRKYQNMLEGKLPLEEKVWTFFVKLFHRVQLYWRLSFKHVLDFVIAVFGLTVCAPILALVALGVKLDSPGPIFFSQTRVGKGGRTFSMYKFRTMRQDAEVNTGPMWAQKNDSRITRFGLFLRKTHLDELPQLFNVLLGHMSLVGPRPERPYFVGEFVKVIPNYKKRLCVKPGITGLAQVRQRYDETLRDVKRKVRYDVLYVHRMCPLLDIKIIALTFGTVIFGTGQ